MSTCPTASSCGRPRPPARAGSAACGPASPSTSGPGPDPPPAGSSAGTPSPPRRGGDARRGVAAGLGMTGRRARAVRWRLVAGQATGPGHERAGEPCADCFGASEIRPGVVSLTVADGAEARLHAAPGATCAVEAATAAAREGCGAGAPADEDAWTDALFDLRKRAFAGFDARVEAAMDDGAGANGRSAERADFATTLCTVVAAEDAVGYVSVGDGFVVAQRDPGGPQLVLAPPLDPDLAGVATFLTSPTRAAAARQRVVVDDRIRGLAVGTDGLLDALLDVELAGDQGPYLVAPPALDRYFDLVGEGLLDTGVLSRTLASPGFAATSDDDKTLVLAVREPATVASLPLPPRLPD